MSVVVDTRYINLNSQHGTSKPTAGDYITSYLSNITFEFAGLLKEEDDILYSHVDITNAQIPISFYNINYAVNTLKYSINGGNTETLTLTRSNYSFITLITEIQTQFSNAGYTFIISYYRPTGKFTFTSTQPFSFLFTGSTIFEVIGLNKKSNYSSTSNILVSEFPASLQTVKKLKFCSSALATNSVGSYTGGSSSLFGIVPVNGVPFGIIQYNNSSGRSSLLKNKVIDSIDIQILNENNQFINFNNIEWAITLAITTTRKLIEKDNKNFSDMLKPILQMMEQPILDISGNIAPPSQAVGLDKSLFTDENDLDFFMYKNGVNI
jgi:hypothetical protein